MVNHKLQNPRLWERNSHYQPPCPAPLQTHGGCWVHLSWALRKNGSLAAAERLRKGPAPCHPSWYKPWDQQADKSCFLHPSRASGTNPSAVRAACEQDLCGLFPLGMRAASQAEIRLEEEHLKKALTSPLCLFPELTDDSHQPAGEPLRDCPRRRGIPAPIQLPEGTPE